MIGLDVSDRSIKIIEISQGRHKTIRTACWSPLPPNLMRRGVIQDEVGITGAIQEAFTKCAGPPIREKMVVVSIPESQSFVQALSVPMMNGQETDEAVQWAVRQHLPFDLERVYIDWQPIPGQPVEGRQDILVGAAQKDVIDPLLDVIDVVGLRVVAFELEAQAIVRSLLPVVSRDISGVLIVDIGATSTNIIFFDRGAIRFTANLQRGGDDLTMQLAQTLGLDLNKAAEQKALIGAGKMGEGEDASVSKVVAEATTHLVEGVYQLCQQMIQERGIQEGVRAVLLSGGSVNLSGIVEIFTSIFGAVPVQIGNPLVNIAIEEEAILPISTKDMTHFTTAIGLALREVDYDSKG